MRWAFRVTAALSIPRRPPLLKQILSSLSLHLSLDASLTMRLTGVIFALALNCLMVDTTEAYYSARLGRFLNRDPIGQIGSVQRIGIHAPMPAGRFFQREKPGFSDDYVDGMNLYANYFLLTNVDPTGLAESRPGCTRFCHIEVRCGPVLLGFRHCGVVVDGVEYGIGGDAGEPGAGASGSLNGSPTLIWGGAIPPEYANPVPEEPPEGVRTHRALCDGPCEDVAKCMRNHQADTQPPPYAAIAGPNSNTYAHRLLNACGCTIDGAPGGAWGWGHQGRRIKILEKTAVSR